MKYILLSQVKHPQRADNLAAGIDFFIPDLWNEGDTFELEPGKDVKIPLGIRVEVPQAWALVMMNKSGVCFNQKLAVGACVVDCGYEGEVHAHLFNYSNSTVVIRPGNKIVQGVLLPVSMEQLEYVESFENKSERGAGGFGSSGV